VLNAGKPLTHRRLLQAVWGPDYGDEPEYLRVVINQLRKKLESDPARPKLILTEPWVGYRFQAPRESKPAKTEQPED
jgi:two-component system KDP operon response regulator KdpE